MFGLLKSKFRKESIRSLLVRLHQDEQGAEGLEKLLIVAAFVLPLLGLLMYYKDSLAEWVADIWDRRRADDKDYSPGGGNR